MLDRESTFADAEIVKLLKTRFIPVAIDQAYQRRQKDAEGDFYRKIAGQGPLSDFNGTTQGLYAASPDGKLFFFNNNRGPERVRKLLQQTLADFKPTEVAKVQRGQVDERFNPQLPQGGLAVRVRAKVLDGYEPTNDPWRKIFNSAVSRDNLWISKREHEALAMEVFPASLQNRIARFHLVDNTRGEPPMWREGEVKKVHLQIDNGTITGKVHLETADGKRGYIADVYGILETADEKVTRLEMVAKGQFWGEGRYTKRAPKGKFPLAVSFELADGSDIADTIPPQGSRGWLPGYLARGD